MRFVKIQNRIINISCIFELVYYKSFDDHFNHIGFKYYLIPIRGDGMEITLDEYNEIKEILFSAKYDDAEA